MSKETTMATQKPETTKSDRTGVVPGVVHLALDVADRGQATAISVLHDARVELRTAVDSGIELAEKLANGAFRFARKLTQRIDDASAEALTGAERVIGGAVKSARETTRAAQELATTAASGVTGVQATA
jgi:hypothetical protein